LQKANNFDLSFQTNSTVKFNVNMDKWSQRTCLGPTGSFFVVFSALCISSSIHLSVIQMVPWHTHSTEFHWI